MARRNHKARRKSNLVSVGVIRITRRGFGFVDTPEGEFFVTRGFLRGAMDGDVVEVVRLRKLEQRRREQRRRDTNSGLRGERGANLGQERVGGVQRVLERAHETLVGTVHLDDGLGVVVPHNAHIPYDIFLDHRESRGKPAKDGDVVVVRLTTYPGRIESAQGYIEEIIGREDDRNLGIEVIIRQHGFETVFSAAALKEADALLEAAGGSGSSGNDSGSGNSGSDSGSGGSGGSGSDSGSGGSAGSEGSGGSRPGSRLAQAVCPNPDDRACLDESREDAGLVRRDLRERFVFTIDPADAKDFDDALSLDYIDGQLRLGVHIADVSAYVAWDGALDLDARRRATSVYLPSRVIPMLPPQLSEELCSLRPHEDKYAFTVDMFMNAEGNVASTEFYPSIIRSSARLTYEEAQDMLDSATPPPLSSSVADAPASTHTAPAPAHTAPAPTQTAPASTHTAPASSYVAPRTPSAKTALLHARLHDLNQLAKRLMGRRLRRGAIDFEGVEAKLTLDADGVPTSVHLRTRTEATSLVEEAMILANEQVASFMLTRDAPMVYRIHDEPTLRALDDLLPTLQEFGYARQGMPQTSQEIQGILEASAGTPEHHLISALLLRAMKRAKYLPVYTTHYGLASPGYTHFTSPIRRYPDLMVHRLLKYLLAAQQDAARQGVGEGSAEWSKGSKVSKGSKGSKGTVPVLPPNMTRQLNWICEHSSQMEREAEQAAREATALKLCEYLSMRIGERFSGVISAVNTTGFTVREDTTTAEGFVSAEDLPATFVYNQERQRYHDPTTNTSYRLGQPVEVILKEADLPHARLIFVLPED